VTPAGPEKDMGNWKGITFSKEQQEKYGVGEEGNVLDEKTFLDAMAAFTKATYNCLTKEKWSKRKHDWCCKNKHLGCPDAKKTGDGLSALPPWWILKGVTPAGPEKDMGSWTAITFSRDQQAKYGIDEEGTVLDKKQFDAAFTAPVAELDISEAPGAELGEPGSATAPWWILNGVTPAGPEKDMGHWTSITFSKEQQDKYGVDETGNVLDKRTFDEALAASKTPKYNCMTKEKWSPSKHGWCCKHQHLGCTDANMTGNGLGALPRWWILKGVKPEGPEKDMGGWTGITFSKEQQAKYGIDETGIVLDKKQFSATFSAPVAELNISEVHTYNCLTRELWSKEKQDWCCKKKSLGCPSEPRMCCMALTAPCLACKQDKTVTEFCDDPANAEVDGCASAEENAAVTQKKVSKALRGSSS